MKERAVLKLRLAKAKEIDKIWQILEQAILRRKLEGSEQWQNGYPNRETVTKDIQLQQGYVFTLNEEPIAYVALIANDEPAYEHIEGAWLNSEDFLVIHRVAIENEYLGKGLIQALFLEIEQFCKEKNIKNIKVDTNFDNTAMLHIFAKLEYHFCGKVVLPGGERLAFQKCLSK